MYNICSMLTKKQKNLLLFINKKIRSSGVSPSYEEMKNSLNLKSKSGIHRLISALEERGFIRRLAHKARALEVLKLPETASANDIYNSFSPSVIKGGLHDENKKKTQFWINMGSPFGNNIGLERVPHRSPQLPTFPNRSPQLLQFPTGPHIPTSPENISKYIKIYQNIYV